MRRRLLAGVAAAGLGLLMAAPSAQAGPADYAGSEVVTKTASTATFVVEAQTHRKVNPGYQLLMKMRFTPPSGLDGDCAGGTDGDIPADELETTPVSGSNNAIASSKATVTTRCNGNYTVDVEANLRGPLGSSDKYTYSGVVKVAVAPPEVENVQGAFNAEGVVIGWDKSSGNAPDFAGYQVQRRNGDDWATLCEGGPDLQNVCADRSPPTEGGDVVYRVRSKRTAPGGAVYSAGGSVTVSLPTTTTTPGGGDGGTDAGTDGGGDGGTTAGTDGGGDGATAGTDGGTGGATGGTTGGKPVPRGGRSFTPIARGRTGIGTQAPRIAGAASANYPDLLLDEDGGYDEIDYGDDGLAGEDDEEDGLSSFYYETTSGKGMAVPIATGFVLAAWAFHLRFLAKAAKPAKAPRGSGRPPRHRPSY